MEKFQWTNEGNLDTVINETGYISYRNDLILFIINMKFVQ